MNADNNCYFSIKLENGIIITGSNPKDVREFLTLLHMALFWACERYRESGQMYLYDESKIIREYIVDATVTIRKNFNKEI